MDDSFLTKNHNEVHKPEPRKRSIYYNDRKKTVYGLHGNTFYQHDKGKWVEIASAKTPFREVSKKTWPLLHESFLEFLLGKELAEAKPLYR